MSGKWCILNYSSWTVDIRKLHKAVLQSVNICITCKGALQTLTRTDRCCKNWPYDEWSLFNGCTEAISWEKGTGKTREFGSVWHCMFVNRM